MSFPLFHKFGSYKGKVLDSETGEPIEGAVVFLRFKTRDIFNPGGPSYHFADAIEVLTNKSGEFHVPSQWLFSFRMFTNWAHHPTVIIFKPGYGAYWQYGTTKPSFKPSYSLPQSKYVEILLPKLDNFQHRKMNLSGATFQGPDVPLNKYKTLRKLKNAERVNLGLTPYDYGSK